jgi:hypothetical protein
MTRTIAALSALALGACSVGSILNQGNPDGGNKMDGNVKMDGAAAICMPITNPAPTAHTHVTAGGGPGQACLSVGCHLPGATGAGANPWLFGGTLYKGDGVTALPGASIVITPAGGGAAMTAISMSDGTFCATAGAANNGCVAGAPIANGATTYVSGCPGTNQNMSTQLQAAGGGNCDNCHKTGGQAGITIQLPGVP